MLTSNDTALSRASSARVPALLAASLAVAVLAVVSFAGTRAGNLDDAFIVLVYARHLVDGAGFVWNDSDGPVEGFTSLLDVLVKAVGQALQPSDPVYPAFASTLFFQVAVAVFGFFVARAILRSSRAAALGSAPRRTLALAATAVAVAASPALADGASYLLETPLFVLLALAAIAFAMRPRVSRRGLVGFGILLALLPAARPEGTLLGATLLVAFVARYRDRLSHRRLVIAPLIFALAVGLLFVFRYSIFGYWAPNTYFAKRSECITCELRDGLHYATAYGATLEGAVVALTCLVSPLVVRFAPFESRRARSQGFVLALAAFVSFVVVVVEGGDGYAGSRFFALASVLAPLVLLALYAGIAVRAQLVPAAIVFALGIADLAAIARTANARIADLRDIFPIRRASFACDEQVATVIRQALPMGSVAQSDYQRLKFFADELRVVDLQGLTNAKIAHRPFHTPVQFGKYTHEWGVEENADLWIYGFRGGAFRVPMARYSMREVLDNRALWRMYVGYTPDVPETAAAIDRAYVPASIPVCGGYFNLLARRDHAKALAARGFVVNGENVPPETFPPVPVAPRDGQGGRD